MVLTGRDLRTIRELPLEDEVERVRQLYEGLCEDEGVPVHPRFLESIDPTKRWSLILRILSGLQNHCCSRVLESRGGYTALRSDLLALELRVDEGKVDVHEFKDIIFVFIDVKEPNDFQVWDAAFALVGTPGEVDTGDDSGVGGSPASEYDSDDPMELDDDSDTEQILEIEPDAILYDIPNFHAEKFGRRCPDLEATAAEIFGECCHGENRLFADGQWLGWPADATPDAIYDWLVEFIKALSALHDARGGQSSPEPRALVRSDPDPVADDEALAVQFKDTWDNTLLVIGLIHGDPAFDNREDAWRPLNADAVYKMSYVEDRRFVFGFTLCGPLMRVWCVSPITGAASTQFNIHEDGERLVHTFLAFLLMKDRALGFG